MCKSHYGNQEFSPLVNVVYFILIIIKIPLRNGNCPIGPITEMGVEHAFEHIHEFTILSCFT